MRIVVNIFAIIGLIAIIAGGVGYAKFNGILSELDPEATKTYMAFAEKFMVNKDPGDAMVWVFPVDEDLTPEEVIDSLKSLATDRDFLFVGESPFYKQVEAVTGTPYRHISFLSFCDVRVGVQMADYNNAYTAFMPCRIAVVVFHEP